MTLWLDLRPVASVLRDPSCRTRITSKDWHGGGPCSAASLPWMTASPVYPNAPSRTVTVAAKSSEYATETIGGAGASHSVTNVLVNVATRPEPPRTVSSSV